MKKMKKVMFMNCECDAFPETYTSGYAKGIALYVAEDGDLMAYATTNLFPELPAEGNVFVKNWSENEGMEKALIEAGLIEPTVIRTLKTGFVTVNEFKLTESALEMWTDDYQREINEKWGE